MSRELLFIRADKEQIPNEHLSAFVKMSEQVGVNVTLKDIESNEDFSTCLNGQNKYVCFAGHGNSSYFGDDKEISIEWSEIGKQLCQSGCFIHNAKILLYCCYGGIEEVSCTLLKECPNLDFIIGCATEINSIDMLNALNIFIYNMERNHKIGDNKAAHRALYATGISIRHYSRNEFDKETQEFICQKCKEYEESNN
ncbi:MAG TPA: hypothetical protein PKY06_20605 [Saprospiraceae bacterium]|nr:hypothetical protein [Flavobacteriaceae bacterium]HPG09366.1 hypothetical protein [Saprospiraceae bacterium]